MSLLQIGRFRAFFYILGLIFLFFKKKNLDSIISKVHFSSKICDDIIHGAFSSAGSSVAALLINQLQTPFVTKKTTFIHG